MLKKAATLLEAVAASSDAGSDVDAAGGGGGAAGVDSADGSTQLGAEAALAAGSSTVADVSGSCPATID
jgi:hypothetical protein